MCLIVEKYKGETLNWALGIVAGMIVALGAVAFVIGKWGGNVKLTGVLVFAISLLVLVAELAAIAIMIKLLGGWTMVGAFVILVALMAALTAAAVILSKIHLDLKGIGKILLLVGGLALIFGVLMAFLSDFMVKIKDVDWKVITAFLVGTAIALGAMAAIVAILGAIPIKLLAVGLIALTALGLILGLLTVVFQAAVDNVATGLWLFGSKMSNATDMMENINWDTIKTAADSVKDVILPLFKSIVSAGIKTGKVESFGHAMFMLANDLKLYYASIEGVDPELIAASAKSITEDIVPAMQAVAPLGELYQSISNATDAMVDLGSAICMYYSSLGEGIDTDIIASSASAVTDSIVPAAVSAATIGGLASDIGNAGTAMTSLGSGVLAYYNSIKDITIAPLLTASLVGNEAVSLATEIRKIGDTSDLEGILLGVSGALTVYNAAISGMNTENIGTIDSKTINSAFSSMANLTIDDETMARFKGYADGDSSGLNSYATGIANLGNALKSYGDNIGTLNITQIVAANLVLKTVAGINSSLNSEDMDGITGSKVNGQETNLAAFGTGIVSLGIALGTYGEKISSLESEKVTAANSALECLSDINAKINSGDMDGIINSKVKGQSMSFSRFAKGITSLGTALGTYGEQIGSLDSDQIGFANDVLDKTSSLDTGLSNLGIANWFKSAIFGKKKDLATFGEDLSALGTCIGEYGKSVKGLTAADISTANRALTVVSAINKSLPETGGMVTWFTGDQKLGKFASNVGSLGDGIAQYANKVNGTNFTNVSDSLDALSQVVEMLGDLEKSGGLASWFTGNKNLSSITKGLSDVGTHLSNYKTNLGSFKLSTVQEGLDAVKAIVDLQSSVDWDNVGKNKGLSSLVSSFSNAITELAKIPSNTVSIKEGGFFSDATTYNALERAGTTLGSALVTAIAKGVTSDPTILSNGITSLINKIADANTISLYATANTSSGTAIGKSFVSALGKGVSGNPTSLITDVAALIRKLSDSGSMSSYGGSITKTGNLIGKAIDKGVATGMKDNYLVIGSALGTAISKLLDSNVLSTYETRFEKIGRYIASGVAKGIERNTYIVQKAARSMADKAYKAYNEESEIESPSKLFEWSGQMSVMGLVKGLLGYSDKVEKASAEIADKAVDSARVGLGVLTSDLFNGIDSTPTIRPVLDLSDVQAGAGLIGGMLGNQTIGIGSASMAGTIQAQSMTYPNQNDISMAEKNLELSNAVKELNNRIDVLGERISTMKVVTETGAIIGQILPDMDRRLGRKQQGLGGWR